MDEIKILFEDENILAIQKPAGLIVHPDGKADVPSVVDFLLEKFPEIKDVGEPMILSSGEAILRPGIVHRIDKETSGVLLVAKTAVAYEHLKNQFQERKIRKTYHTFVYGPLREERGIINKPIGRSSGGIRRWAVSGIRGEAREATTKYKVIKETPEASFLEVWPLTGRTHQIRAHFRGIRHPIVGDDLYGSKIGAKLAPRSMLHALSLAVSIPEKGEMTFEAKVPKDMLKVLAELGFSC